MLISCQRLTSLILTGAFLVQIVGCGSAPGEPLEEVEHIRPDHWPATFVELVEQIDDRFDQHDVDNPANELADLLKWLPEIAGDTSLSESDWNAAVHAGNHLVQAFENGGDPSTAINKLRHIAEKTKDDYPPFVPGRHEISEPPTAKIPPTGGVFDTSTSETDS